VHVLVFISYLRQSLNSQHQPGSDQLHVLYTLILCFLHTACNRQYIYFHVFQCRKTQIFDVASQTCCSHYKADLTILCAYQRKDILHVTDTGCLLQVYLLFSCHFIWRNMPSRCNMFCTFQGNLVVSEYQKRIETMSYPRKKNISATRRWRAKNSMSLF